MDDTAMPKITDPSFDATLTLRQSFHVLIAFLEQFNSRGPTQTFELWDWLLLQQDGTSSDPAQLDDYLRSARSILQQAGPNVVPLL